MKKTVTVLGSTGSIGTQSLDVCRKIGYRVLALSGHRNAALLEKQAREFLPRYLAVTDPRSYSHLKVALADTDIQVLEGMEGLCHIASLPENDVVLNSVMGMVGLRPTLAAIEAGTTVALANKETLVAGGELVMGEARKKGVSILPVDSEHSAIFQSLQGRAENSIRKIILTASGGPFFGKTKEELTRVTIKDALAHPNWSMGAKITVDSATLMNKGLEFIEAMRLFDVSADQIEVVVHRESILHSAVEFDDHSVIGQMGVPDMKIPIQYALTYPKRVDCDVKPLSFTDIGSMTFYKPDTETFRCLPLAISAIRQGGLAPSILNGANEEAVAAFLAGEIGFMDIPRLVEKTMDTVHCRGVECLEDILEADAEARRCVKALLGRA